MPKSGGAEWFLYSAVGSVFLFLSIMGCDCDNTKREIIVEGPTKVIASSECSYHAQVKVIAVLNKGDKVKVLDQQMKKACTVWKIKLADGRVGYITIGDHFRPYEYYCSTVFALIEDSTNLMSMPDTVGAPGNIVIALLQKGDEARIISSSYGKRMGYYSIMLDDGRMGYLNSYDKFKFVEEKK